MYARTLMMMNIFNFFFLFFKQKTAYELRISDWSSDVCSSDLLRFLEISHDPDALDRDHRHQRSARPDVFAGLNALVADHARDRCADDCVSERDLGQTQTGFYLLPPRGDLRGLGFDDGELGSRSEEHTSELQSLMRISYAVL